MTEGIRKEKNLPDRIARSLIQNEELFIQSLKIFANTSIVGSQGVQSGGSSGGPSGLGNYLVKPGDIMDGPLALRPSIASIVANQIDIRKITETNYNSKIFLIAEGVGATEDELNFILGGSQGNFLVGSEFPGQILVISPIESHTITINNDPSGVGDATAVPPFNIRTPDGSPVVLKSQQSVMLIYDSTSSQWNFLGAVGSSIAGDPQCFTEKDLGDVSGAQSIVFNDNAFARMRVIGATTITFDVSSLVIGKWYKLTVEILQDPGGGNVVTFADAPFQNQVTPIVYTAGNRFTSIRFYAYTNGTVARIFAFEENQPFPIQFFDGYIQARLDTDQTANLTPNKHIEFDLKIATDNTIVVSVGGGQAAGIFSNFEVGHLYQCECHYSIEGVISSSELTVQFYNVTKGQFFGSQGRAKLTTHTLLESSQPVAKGFFVADSIGEQIEVRIRASSGIDKIIAGSGSGDSTSYVVIKDCGVAGIENLEGNLVDAPTPSGPDSIAPLKGYMIGHTQQGTTVLAHRSMGGDPGIVTLTNNQVPAMGAGKYKKLRTNIHINAPGNLKVFTVLNGVPSTELDSFSGLGIHETDLLDRPFVKDDLISLGLQRSSSVDTMHWNTWLELEYSFNDFWFYGPRILGAQNVNRFCPLIGNSIFDNPSGPEFNNRNAHQRSFGRSGIIKDFVYYGTAPAGTGTTIFSIEVNGLSVFNSPDVPVHAGFAIDRFDGVNIVVSADDLINVKMNGRNGTNLDGIFGCRFTLD